MGVLYFIPARRFSAGRVPDVLKARRLSAEGEACLEDFGLGHLDGASLAYRGVVNQGPDGGAGLCIGLGIPANETGMMKGQQWMPVEKGNLYLGWYTKAGQPGPAVFLRERALPALVTMVMGDGQPWGFVPTRALPERLGFTAAGEEAWLPCPEHSTHYIASAWLMDYLLAMEDAPLLDVVDRVVTCMATRYHVSRLEVAALGLYREDWNLRIIAACLGMDWETVLKKKEAMAAV